jgi:hypothetical protein
VDTGSGTAARVGAALWRVASIGNREGKRVRTRSIKPAWLDDEKLASCSDAARTLSIALILMADDHGNGRAAPMMIRNRVWGFSAQPPANPLEIFAELEQIGFVVLYQVNGESYFSLPNFPRHQKLDYVARPAVPGPATPGASVISKCSADFLQKSGEVFPGSAEIQKNFGQRREEKRREEKSRGEKRTASPPPKARAGSSKRSGVLAKHRAEAERLWQLQDELRLETIPGARALKPTEKLLERIAERLEEGATPDDCEAVLRHYADRARRDPGQRQWFNGTTNWRPDNFSTALGMSGAGFAVGTNGVHGKAKPLPIENVRKEIWR